MADTQYVAKGRFISEGRQIYFIFMALSIIAFVFVGFHNDGYNDVSRFRDLLAPLYKNRLKKW